MIHEIRDINTVFEDIDNQKDPMTPTSHIYLSFKKKDKFEK
jgi:hypothetical protein